MKIIENMKDFLIDKEYYLDMFENKFHAYNYIKLLKITNEFIKLKFNNFILIVNGKDIKVLQMNKKEILFSGKFNKMEIKYE